MSSFQKWVLVFGAALICNVVCRGHAIPSEPTNPDHRPGLTIKGTVFDPSGAPAPGVVLSLLAPQERQTKSDTKGEYTITWAGQPPLERRKEGLVPNWEPVPDCSMVARDLEHNLATGHDFDETTTNLNLHLQPGLTISTKVVDLDGNPISNAEVYLTISRSFSWSLTIPRVGQSDAQGLVRIPALPQGYQYFLDAWAPGYGTTARRNLIHEADTRTNRLDVPAIVLKRADLKLAGQVLGSDGKPVAAARVSTYGEGQPGVTTHTDANGRFLMNVCEGPVSVNATLAGVTGQTDAKGGDTDLIIRLPESRQLPEP
jgi:hypothetical protein